MRHPDTHPPDWHYPQGPRGKFRVCNRCGTPQTKRGGRWS